MDEEIAEFIGIFIGDGSLNIREHKHSYEFKFTGNPRDEVPYFDCHVSKLASGILSRSIKTKILDCGRSVGLYFCSKEFAGYLATLGIKSGPKAERITIPPLILKNRRWAIACLRGVFDTDGCFTLKKNGKYPVITFGMKNKNLLIQMGGVLKQISIRYCLCFDVPYFDPRLGKTYTKHYLSINGAENVAKWFDLVGSNNPKILKKYQGYKSLL
ncbi:MAG: LAGLIDADG family homing endonuclease [Candidatus ainarchaeum sp.]|nr:LAGLIDADG family homing endonuclease [Candidatus ainarchaeum sp.]